MQLHLYPITPFSNPLVRASWRNEMLLLGLTGIFGVTRLSSFRVAATVWRAGPNLARLGCLGLHEWPVALDLLVPHDDEPSDDCDPVEAVGNH